MVNPFVPCCQATFIPCSAPSRPAAGCSTWYTGTSGTVHTFNHQDGGGELINNQDFSYCLAGVAGYCHVTLSST